MSEDAIANFKEAQKQGWAHFAPLEAVTTPSAALLVKFAGVRAGQRVLDVACGTGVAAITAARLGADVCGIDLTPELLARARENSAIAEVPIDWRQGDAEQLPYDDAGFDVVLSQFGHIFAPRPEIATREMLRVLKPSGTIAFATWPPTLCIGRTFILVASYMPQRRERTPRTKRDQYHISYRANARPGAESVTLPRTNRGRGRADAQAGGDVKRIIPGAAYAIPSRIRGDHRRLHAGQSCSSGLPPHP